MNHIFHYRGTGHTGALIRLVPKMLHGVVDFLHLEAVVLHDGAKKCMRKELVAACYRLLIQCFGVLLEVIVRHVRDLITQSKHQTSARQVYEYLDSNELVSVLLVDIPELSEIIFGCLEGCLQGAQLARQLVVLR